MLSTNSITFIHIVIPVLTITESYDKKGITSSINYLTLIWGGEGVLSILIILEGNFEGERGGGTFATQHKIKCTNVFIFFLITNEE